MMTGKSIFFLICILLFLETTINGQGLLFDDEAYQKVEEVSSNRGTRGRNLPDAVDLTKYCPTPSDQGDKHTCIANVLGHGLQTIMYAKKLNWTKEEIQQNKFSIHFMYNQMQNMGCKTDVALTKGFEFLKEHGNLPAIKFDNLNQDNCQLQPNKDKKKAAKQYQISDFIKIFDFNANRSEKVYATKKHLDAGYPVAIGMKLYENFQNLSTSMYDLEKGDNTALGGHAVVVVGYDNSKGAFKIMNSYGTDWGENGFAWIYYEDFETLAHYAMIMNLKTTKDIAGEFKIRTYDAGEFERETVLHLGNGFYTVRNDIRQDDIFQLLAKDIPKGKYLYVYSIDPKNKVECFWPEVDLTQRVDKTPLVVYTDEVIVIPGENSGLKKKHIGVEYLVVFYSDIKLSTVDLQQCFGEISINNFESSFRKKFQKILSAPEEISYNDNKMSFATRNSTDDKVIPLILKFGSNQQP